MKLRAIHPIKNGLKWTEPGKGFDCKKEDAEGLISAGYAELFHKEEEEEATNSAADSAGGGVDAAPAPLSEGIGIG